MTSANVESKPAQSTGRRPSLVAMPATHESPGSRVFLFISSALLLTGLVSMIFADLLWRTGWSSSRTMLLSLFVVLFFLSAIGCVQAVYGFTLRRVRDSQSITQLRDYHQPKH